MPFSAALPAVFPAIRSTVSPIAPRAASAAWRARVARRAFVALVGAAACAPLQAETASEPGIRPAGAAAALYECQGSNGGIVFRASPREGCTAVAGGDPATLDPQRWVPLMGANGLISYLDQRSVRRWGSEVGVVLMRNAPSGAIRTASGEPIRSSLRRMVLNCATSMYTLVEQTLFPRRFARGEALYTIRASHRGMPQPAASGTVPGELLTRFCR